MVGIAAAAARSWPLILATATRVGPGSTAADAVVVDLEDGVPDHDKHRAREVAAAPHRRRSADRAAYRPDGARRRGVRAAHGASRSAGARRRHPAPAVLDDVLLHALSALLVFAAFTAGWRARQRPIAWLVLAGLLTAFAVTVEYSNAIAGAAIGIYAFARPGGIVRRAVVYGAAFLAGLAPLLAYHWWAFGSPFESARSHALYFRGEGAIEHAGQTGGLFGLEAFPSLGRAVTLLFSEWGLLAATPSLLPCAAGTVRARASGLAAEALLIGSLWLAYLLLSMSYYSIFGDFAGGPRYLVPVLPLLALPLAAAAKRWPGEALGLTLASVAMMVGLTLARPLFATEGALLDAYPRAPVPPTAAS